MNATLSSFHCLLAKCSFQLCMAFVHSEITLKCSFFKSYHVCQLFFAYCFLYFIFCFSFFFFSLNIRNRSIDRDSSKDSHLSSSRDSAVATPGKQTKSTTSNSRKLHTLSSSYFMVFVIFNNVIMNSACVMEKKRKKNHECI